MIRNTCKALETPRTLLVPIALVSIAVMSDTHPLIQVTFFMDITLIFEVQCGAVWCSVVQCGAVRCSVLQCVAVCCSARTRDILHVYHSYK